MTVERPRPHVARHLRRNGTHVGHLLWRRLRDRQVLGAKFRRQVPVGPYVVDFACLEARLVVELDGGQHMMETPTRQRWLEAQGFRLLRFWNNDVLERLDGVLSTIVEVLTSALSRGERELEDEAS